MKRYCQRKQRAENVRDGYGCRKNLGTVAVAGVE